MIDETAMEFFGDNPEPCLAGTFCLMSLYRDNPCPIIAHKIIDSAKANVRPHKLTTQ